MLWPPAAVDGMLMAVTFKQKTKKMVGSQCNLEARRSLRIIEKRLHYYYYYYSRNAVLFDVRSVEDGRHLMDAVCDDHLLHGTCTVCYRAATGTEKNPQYR